MVGRGEAPVHSTFTLLRSTGTKADCCALAFFAFQPFQLDVGTVFMTLRPFEAGVKSAFAQLNREPMRGLDMFQCLSREWPWSFLAHPVLPPLEEKLLFTPPLPFWDLLERKLTAVLWPSLHFSPFSSTWVRCSWLSDLLKLVSKVRLRSWTESQWGV